MKVNPASIESTMKIYTVILVTWPKMPLQFKIKFKLQRLDKGIQNHDCIIMYKNAMLIGCFSGM